MALIKALGLTECKLAGAIPELSDNNAEAKAWQDDLQFCAISSPVSEKMC